MAKYKFLSKRKIEDLESEINDFLFLINWLKYSLFSFKRGRISNEGKFYFTADIIYESRGMTPEINTIMDMKREQLKEINPELKERITNLVTKFFGEST